MDGLRSPWSSHRRTIQQAAASRRHRRHTTQASRARRHRQLITPRRIRSAGVHVKEPDMTDTYPETPDAPPLPSPGHSAEAVPKPTAEGVFVGTGLFWGLVIGVVLAVAVIVLAAQNTERAAIAFLGWGFSTPLIVVILASLVAGVIFDELFGLVYRVRRRKTLNERDQLKRIKRSATTTE